MDLTHIPHIPVRVWAWVSSQQFLHRGLGLFFGCLGMLGFHKFGNMMLFYLAVLIIISVVLWCTMPLIFDLWSYISWTVSLPTNYFVQGFILGWGSMWCVLYIARTKFVYSAVLVIVISTIFLVMWYHRNTIFDFVKNKLESYIREQINKLILGFIIGCAGLIGLIFIGKAMVIFSAFLGAISLVTRYFNPEFFHDVIDKIQSLMSTLRSLPVDQLISGVIVFCVGLFIILKTMLIFSVSLGILTLVTWFFNPNILTDAFDFIKSCVSSLLNLPPGYLLGSFVSCVGLLGLFFLGKVMIVLMAGLGIISLIVWYISPSIFEKVRDIVSPYINRLVSLSIVKLVLGFILGRQTLRFLLFVWGTKLFFPVFLIIIFMIKDFMSNNRLIVIGLLLGILIGFII